jgi:hypothetical protein
VALLFCVVVFGQGRDHSGSVGELSDAAEDDFGAAVVELDWAVDFDDASFEAADVAYIFKIGGEDDHGERASRPPFAKTDEANSFGADFHMQHFAGNAFGFAHVLAGLAYGKAIGCSE